MSGASFVDVLNTLRSAAFVQGEAAARGDDRKYARASKLADRTHEIALAMHRREVEAGRMQGLAEIDNACERLHDHNGGQIELHRCWMAGRGRDEGGWYAVGQPPNPRGVFPRDTPTGAICVAADNIPTATATAAASGQIGAE